MVDLVRMLPCQPKLFGWDGNTVYNVVFDLGMVDRVFEDEPVAFGCDFVIATAAAGAAVYESLFDEFCHFSED